MNIHPIAECFPPLESDELKQLADDIKRNGQLHPIITYQGAILDGRNRDRACALAGVKPRYEEWRPRHGSDDPVVFAISANMQRRHLTPSQRAAIYADIEEVVKRGGDRRSEDFKARQRALEKTKQVIGAKATSIDHAREVKQKAPKLHDAVKAGKINLTAAARAACAPKNMQEVVLQHIEAGDDVSESDVVKYTTPERQHIEKEKPDILVAAHNELGSIRRARDRLREIIKSKEYLSDAGVNQIHRALLAYAGDLNEMAEQLKPKEGFVNGTEKPKSTNGAGW